MTGNQSMQKAVGFLRERVLPGLKWRLHYLAPQGYYVLRDRRRHEAGRRRVEAGKAALAARRSEGFSYDGAIRFLAGRGLDETQVREGSMPESSLDYAAGLMREHLPRDRPVIGLHVGTFVGVSLAYTSATLRELHPQSVVVSVDPNIEHRGIANPMSHVLALLGEFDLLASNLVITGYSLEQSMGASSEADPLAHILRDQACEHALASLARTTGERFDVVLLDGNHVADYLEREITVLRTLMRPGALVVVDDVDAVSWRDIVGVFERVTSGDSGLEELGRDGRVGVLRLKG